MNACSYRFPEIEEGKVVVSPNNSQGANNAAGPETGGSTAEPRGKRARQEIQEERFPSLKQQLEEAVRVSSKVSDAEVRLKRARREGEESIREVEIALETVKKEVAARVELLEEEIKELKAEKGYRTREEMKELFSVMKDVKVRRTQLLERYQVHRVFLFHAHTLDFTVFANTRGRMYYFPTILFLFHTTHFSLSHSF